MNKAGHLIGSAESGAASNTEPAMHIDWSRVDPGFLKQLVATLVLLERYSPRNRHALASQLEIRERDVATIVAAMNAWAKAWGGTIVQGVRHRSRVYYYRTPDGRRVLNELRRHQAARR